MGVEIQLFECMHKTAYRRYEEKTNGLVIAFIDYENDLSKL
jgi:hypothetical protein